MDDGTRSGGEVGPVGVVVRLRRLGYRTAFAGLRVWWFVRRPQTHGVKLLVRRGDELLFVRHSYGEAVWEVPGGGRRRGEPPERTATRELAEELGLDVREWREVGSFVSRRRATANLTCLVGDHPGGLLAPARQEIVEARWAPAAHPPEPLGEHARSALDLLAAADQAR